MRQPRRALYPDLTKDTWNDLLQEREVAGVRMVVLTQLPIQAALWSACCNEHHVAEMVPEKAR